jgi:glycosyltransferase involved in cell wall biosynthesis
MVAPPASSRRVARNVVCVVPCYNVAALCGPVLSEACRHGDRVIAVDDGSVDGTGEVLRSAARESGGRIHVITHGRNRGKGAALLAAFQEALAGPAFEVLVTLDGDQQHRPSDIPLLVRAWSEGADLVIGGRSALRTMPLRSRIGNTITAFFLTRFYRDCPADTQSGFRAIDRGFLEEIVARIDGRRYETEMRILLLALTRKRRIASVPIPTLYLDGNRSSNYRPLSDSLRILVAVLRWARPARRGPGTAEKIQSFPRENP